MNTKTEQILSWLWRSLDGSGIDFEIKHRVTSDMRGFLTATPAEDELITAEQRVIDLWNNLKYHIEQQTDINTDGFDKAVRLLTANTAEDERK